MQLIAVTRGAAPLSPSRAQVTAATSWLETLLRHCVYAEALLRHLHVCDVYVLRRALPHVALSVTALERARGLPAGSARRELTRYALATLRTWPLYAWAVHTAHAPAHGALAAAVDSGVPALYLAVRADALAAAPSPSLHELAVRAARVSAPMLRCVLTACGGDAGDAAWPPRAPLSCSVLLEAVRAGRLDVLEAMAEAGAADALPMNCAAVAVRGNHVHVLHWLWPRVHNTRLEGALGGALYMAATIAIAADADGAAATTVAPPPPLDAVRFLLAHAVPLPRRGYASAIIRAAVHRPALLRLFVLEAGMETNTTSHVVRGRALARAHAHPGGGAAGGQCRVAGLSVARGTAVGVDARTRAGRRGGQQRAVVAARVQCDGGGAAARRAALARVRVGLVARGRTFVEWRVRRRRRRRRHIGAVARVHDGRADDAARSGARVAVARAARSRRRAAAHCTGAGRHAAARARHGGQVLGRVGGR